MPTPDELINAACQQLREAAQAVDTDTAFWNASIDGRIVDYGRAVAKRATIYAALQQLQSISTTSPLATAPSQRVVPERRQQCAVPCVITDAGDQGHV